MDLEIKTERLILRPFRMEDAPRVHALLGAWEVSRMLAVVPHPYPEGAAERWITTHAPRRDAGTAYLFAVTLNDETVGAIGIHKQNEDFVLGYWLGVPYWGRGLMFEAVQALIDFAFITLTLPRLLSGYFVENARSARILRKTGFALIAHETKHCIARGEDIPHVAVALSRDVWMTTLEIKTERLVLRPFRLEDGPRVRELVGAWDVAKMLTVVPHPYPDGAAEQWIATLAPDRDAGTAYHFAITTAGELAGAIGINKDGPDFVLGYWLGIPYWGRGFMPEAVAGVIRFAFTALALPRLVSGYFTENERSARILRKAGFIQASCETKHCVARGEDIPHVSVVLSRDTWAAKSGIK